MLTFKKKVLGKTDVGSGILQLLLLVLGWVQDEA